MNKYRMAKYFTATHSVCHCYRMAKDRITNPNPRSVNDFEWLKIEWLKFSHSVLYNIHFHC